jgi:hypothetical protein
MAHKMIKKWMKLKNLQNVFDATRAAKIANGGKNKMLDF